MKFTIGNTVENSTNVNLSINFSNISLQEAVTILEIIDAKIGGNLSKLDKEIVALIKSESFLIAVKYCKDQTGWGLKESKDHCDKLKEKYCVA